MEPMPAADLEARVQASPLLATYGTRLDPDSAYEMLARRMEAAAADAAAAEAEKEAARAAAAAAKEAAAAEKAAAAKERQEERDRSAAQQEYERAQREFERAERAAEARQTKRSSPRRTTTTRSTGDPLSDLLGSGLGRTIAKEVVQGIFSTLRRRR